ncbi:hypothetical protein BJY01DRAFT_200055 [Aspergillus pseudoustus]|uniref:DUF7580 domain-containing protein n=1 Tax=Aspergillus pseudoustus TaxID=1810923 RepID=A0ABR4JRU6_9EURO
METAGLILATVPLILAVLEKHIETLDTIRLFRTHKYRRYLEQYSSTLAAQQASLLNAIEIVLDIKITREGVDDLSHPNGNQWKDPTLQIRLQSRLDRDYDIFMHVLGNANHTLQELKLRLDEEASIPRDKTRSRVVAEFRKAKNILSKQRYDRLLNDLDASIGLLNRLLVQSVHRQEHHQIGQASQYGLVRTPAASIHRAILRQESWCCSCREKHYVRFNLDSNFQERTSKIIFRMGIATLHDSAQSLYCWHEIEVEPSKDRTSSAQITNMCSTIAALGELNENRKNLGNLSEGEYRHSVFVDKISKGRLESKSLDDLLMSSSLAPWIPGFYFRKRDRLDLAIRLAWSVLHFHGNWLPEHWRSRDILFPKSAAEDIQGTIENPYLSWNVSHQVVASPGISSIVTSRVLFPLGLALIELSLCRSISALQTPADDNPEEAVSLLKTANRCLEAVSSESGDWYGTVVQRCLYWSETRETDPSDETFQAAFYRLVLTPLLNTMQAFDSARSR